MDERLAAMFINRTVQIQSNTITASEQTLLSNCLIWTHTLIPKLMKFIFIYDNYHNYVISMLHTCSTGNPILLVHVLITSLTGLPLALPNESHKSSVNAFLYANLFRYSFSPLRNAWNKLSVKFLQDRWVKKLNSQRRLWFFCVMEACSKRKQLYFTM